MNLADFRKSLGLSQEECAAALGLKSKTYICQIERGSRSAPVALAMKIERWSGGKVRAASISKAARDIAKLRPAVAEKPAR